MTDPADAARVQRRRPRWWGIAGAALAVTLLGGYLAADIADVAPGVLTAEPPRPEPVPFPTPSVRMAGAGEGLTPVDASAPEPEPEHIAELAEEALGGELADKVGVEIRDGLTGTELFSRGAGEPHTPASVTKVLTAAAALADAGGETRLATTALLREETVILRGGGDVLLGEGESDEESVDGRAGLASLAKEAAARLHGRGIERVTVVRDESLFTGEDFHPSWDRADVGNGFVAPLSPLMVSAGRTGPERNAPRTDEPGAFATEAFASALEDAGIEVADDAGTAEAGAGDEELAEVLSAPLRAQVHYLLVSSDNVVSEAIGRAVALARGEEPSFEGAAAAVEDSLAELGLDAGGIALTDLSGLSYDNRIPPASLVALFRIAIEDGGSLAELPALMPVAGWSGTLAQRFQDEETADGAGTVRAKTGTLRSVASLSGTLVTAEGRLLVFAVMGDDLEPAQASRARTAMDELLADVAACGC